MQFLRKSRDARLLRKLEQAAHRSLPSPASQGFLPWQGLLTVLIALAVIAALFWLIGHS